MTENKLILKTSKCSQNRLTQSSVLSSLISENQVTGLYLIDDLIDRNNEQAQRRQREAQIQNVLDHLRNSRTPVFLVFLGNVVQFSERLSAEIPVLKVPLPSEIQVQEILSEAKSKYSVLQTNNNEFSWKRLIVACMGLPRGEIELALNTYSDVVWREDGKQRTAYNCNYKTRFEE